MIFVDGLGMGLDHPEINPVASGASPFLRELMLEFALPIDATLGVTGMPQSATGQASLFTGSNASALMGRHMEGVPGPALKKLVSADNLYRQLAARGYRSTFANAYWAHDTAEVSGMRRQSVSTVAALSGLGEVRTRSHLLKNQAVYQDITRELLIHRGYTGPLVMPEVAAEHLVAIAAEHDFTLFEYFQTDLMAHRGSEDDVRRVLDILDRFVAEVLGLWDEDGHLFVLTSDHGNVEDVRTRHHTMNPVPFVAIGQGGYYLRERVLSLPDFVPALLKLYPAAHQNPALEAGHLEF